MKEGLGSSETSVTTKDKRRNIPEDAILHSHHRENLKSYKEIGYIPLITRGWKDMKYLNHCFSSF
jgi:hypothetical protein